MVMVVLGGYLEVYEKGKEIFGIDVVKDFIVFYVGMVLKDGKVVINGGCVIVVILLDKDFRKVIKKLY